MPDPGEGLAEAEIVSWQVSVGDQVREDQDLVTVETAKAMIVIPCPVSGVLVERYGEEGDTVQVGDVLAVFDDTRPEPQQAGPRQDVDQAEGTEPLPDAAIGAAGGARTGVAPGAESAPATKRPLASPAVRRRARELGIDLATVSGTGPAGRILESDLLGQPSGSAAGSGASNDVPAPRPAPATTPAPSPPPAVPASAATAATAATATPATTVETPLRGLRRTIGRTMTAGWQTIPHMFDFREADATGLLQARDALREQARRAGDTELADALSPVALLVKIAGVALARHPQLHGYVDEDREVLVHHRRCHLGIAMATPDGLLTPVLPDVDRRPLRELARQLRVLGRAARERTLTPQQLSGATFLVNNLGALGTNFGTPLIPPGLGGNLGFGRITERPVVRDGQIVAAPILPLSISADHRLVDGDVLAAFARTVAELVENPVLLLEGLC